MNDERNLIASLGEAAKRNSHPASLACQVCDALARMSPSARKVVESHLTGTIGTETLAKILTENGYPTGRRAVVKHKKGHAA